jgi:hypothetical protein
MNNYGQNTFNANDFDDGLGNGQQQQDENGMGYNQQYQN